MALAIAGGTAAAGAAAAAGLAAVAGFAGADLAGAGRAAVVGLSDGTLLILCVHDDDDFCNTKIE
jgi:hypothetical protein